MGTDHYVGNNEWERYRVSDIQQMVGRVRGDGHSLVLAPDTSSYEAGSPLEDLVSRASEDDLQDWILHAVCVRGPMIDTAVCAELRRTLWWQSACEDPASLGCKDVDALRARVQVFVEDSSNALIELDAISDSCGLCGTTLGEEIVRNCTVSDACAMRQALTVQTSAEDIERILYETDAVGRCCKVRVGDAGRLRDLPPSGGPAFVADGRLTASQKASHLMERVLFRRPCPGFEEEVARLKGVVGGLLRVVSALGASLKLVRVVCFSIRMRRVGSRVRRSMCCARASRVDGG